MDLGDCPVCLLPQSNCPRFVLPCQDALTSARHNCAQLSQKVAAMWHDLKGIWGVGDVREENAVTQTTGWYTIRSYLVSCLSKKNKHATFILSQLNNTRTEYCIIDSQYVSYLALTITMPTGILSSPLRDFGSTLSAKMINSCSHNSMFS